MVTTLMPAMRARWIYPSTGDNRKIVALRGVRRRERHAQDPVTKFDYDSLCQLESPAYRSPNRSFGKPEMVMNRRIKHDAADRFQVASRPVPGTKSQETSAKSGITSTTTDAAGTGETI